MKRVICKYGWLDEISESLLRHSYQYQKDRLKKIDLTKYESYQIIRRSSSWNYRIWDEVNLISFSYNIQRNHLPDYLKNITFTTIWGVSIVMANNQTRIKKRLSDKLLSQPSTTVESWTVLFNSTAKIISNNSRT